MSNWKQILFGVASLTLAAWTPVSYGGVPPNNCEDDDCGPVIGPTIPEPTTILLLVAGAAAGVARKMRNRK